jgi:hypothetical protein
MRSATDCATRSILIEVMKMALALVNSFAPPVRHDHDGRSDTPIIDARNVAVNFKVEDGMVEAVKDVSFQLYRGETIAVQSGDQIMVVSDGIIEQFGIVPKPDGTMSKRQFQMEGLQEVMSQVSQDIVQDVFAAVIAHAGTDQLSDDATAVLVKWQ